MWFYFLSVYFHHTSPIYSLLPGFQDLNITEHNGSTEDLLKKLSSSPLFLGSRSKLLAGLTSLTLARLGAMCRQLYDPFC